MRGMVRARLGGPTATLPRHVTHTRCSAPSSKVGITLAPPKVVRIEEELNAGKPLE